MILTLARRFAASVILRENRRLRADIDTWKGQARDWERRHNEASDRLTQQLTQANRALADVQQQSRAAESTLRAVADAKWQDHMRIIADLRERNERQGDTIEHLERQLREANATIEGLGLANAELEKRLEHKQFVDEDDAFRRRMDGEADHL